MLFTTGKHSPAILSSRPQEYTNGIHLAAIAAAPKQAFIAVSDISMNWAAAKAWCEQRGGRLPLINGAVSLTWNQITGPRTALIDGFGQINTGPSSDWTTPWESTGLPLDLFWSGTGHRLPIKFPDGKGG